MKKFIIVDNESLKIATWYESVEQQKYGGPWGDPSLFTHVGLQAASDKDCLIITKSNGIIHVTDDLDKLAAKTLQAERELLQRKVADAIAFGQKLLTEFAAENIALGITQAGKTKSVRMALADAQAALSTGSLYDAIAELKSIPEEVKDNTFLTDARLLSAINKIETYLGLAPLSTSLE